MGWILQPGQPDPELDREKLLARIAGQAIRISSKLLAERKPARKRKAAA